MHSSDSIREALGLLVPTPGETRELRLEAIWQLIVAGEDVREALREQLAREGLTIDGFQTLAALHQVEPEAATPTMLARKTDTTRALLSHTLTRLEISHLITRERDAADRRVVWVRLTDEGREIIQRALGAARNCLARLAAQLGQRELTQLIAACAKVDRTVRQRPQPA